jgi:RNA 3'-terminal phosphate cyclase
LLIYLALAGGTSRFRACELSSHARTTLWVLERLLPLHHREVDHGDLRELELLPG